MSRALDVCTQSLVSYYADLPSQRPSEWCVENLRFNEPGNHGPFSLAGAEYCAEPLDDWANSSITDEVLVWGSQTHKTGTLMGGAAWASVNDPCGFMWVMPSMNLAQRFTRKRWIPLLKASVPTANLLPRGAQRHDLKTLEQRVGAASFTFVGSNSAANLASDPCRRVVLDEVDKFDSGGREEADAVNLAEQRTKGQPNPQRFKTSTPTMIDGLIWQEALKGDMRRYFVPCPECDRHVVLAWSEAFTVLPKTGSEAYVVWDKEAKRTDGSWDFERVEKSARFRCPHCAGDIIDARKTWMNREGIWKPTQRSAPGFVSRHLPSLYACAPETTVGKLAVKFLTAKKSLLGLQGFINGDLAEPYQSQDRQSERVELITSKIEITAEWNELMTGDCQAKSPHFWFTKRAWGGTESVATAAGSADTWDELRALQRGVKGWHVAGTELLDSGASVGVVDAGVMIDSGWGARSESDVYVNCANFGEFTARQHPQKPVFIGWMPAKGFPNRRRWKDPESGLMVPYYLRSIDPFEGSTGAGKVEMNLFEFSGDFFKDILDKLRRDKDGQCGHKWSVSADVANDEYWRHMDAEHKVAERNSRTGFTQHIWRPRSKHWPNHILDCEVQQIAFATFLRIFKLPDEPQ